MSRLQSGSVLWTEVPETPLTVPLLVARDELEFPIIGYKVIEEVIKDRDLVGGESADSFAEIMSSAFSEVKQEGITALVELVQSANVESLCVLRGGKSNMTVPRGQTVSVACMKKTPVLFEPAQEPTWAADQELSEQLLSLPRGLHRKVKY